MKLIRRFLNWAAFVNEVGSIAPTFNTDASDRYSPKHFQLGGRATRRDQKHQTAAMDWAYLKTENWD